jgi:hypothetical protein
VKSDDLRGAKGLSIVPALRMRVQSESGNDFAYIELIVHRRIIFLYQVREKLI